MAGITHRTVFAEFTKSSDGYTKYLRFADWALVLTSLGPMAEMFNANQRAQVAGWANQTAYDATDQMTMINSIEFASADTLPLMLSGNNSATPLHGGTPMPRAGR